MVWKIINNALGLIGLFLGLVSVWFGYMAYKLTKKSVTAVLDLELGEGFIVRENKKIFVFIRIIMRNIGGSWIKLIPFVHTSISVYMKDKEYHFLHVDLLKNENIFNIALKKFKGGINFDRINKIPEIFLYPRGLSYDFYFVGKYEGNSHMSMEELQNAYVKIPFVYETEHGTLETKTLRIIINKIKSGLRDTDEPVFYIKLPLIFEDVT